MTHFFQYISKRQIALFLFLISVSATLTGGLSERHNRPILSPLTLSDMTRELPQFSQIELDLLPLVEWGLSIDVENKGLSSQQNGILGIEENPFSGPPPIFAVLQENDVISVYVKGESGFDPLRVGDNFQGNSVKNITMSSIEFETLSGENITVSLFNPVRENTK